MKIIITLFFLFLLTFAASAQTSSVTFEEVKLTGIGSISIPSIMELQSGAYKEFSDKGSKELGADVSGVIIYQQAGLNSFPRKSNTYARLMIKETIGKPGEYHTINSKLVLTPNELKTLSTQTKTELTDQFQSSGTGLKMLRWDGASVYTINGVSALKVAYLRQLNNNPSVYVEIYHIDNYDRQYTLTISYRLEDSAVWKDALDKAKNSFKITAIRKPPARRRK